MLRGTHRANLWANKARRCYLSRPLTTAPDHIRAADAGQHAKVAEVPVLNFAPFYSDDAVARAELGAELLAAFKDIGFVTLVNHNLPAELNNRAFEASASFFNGLTPTQKAKYEWVSPESNRGYLAMGQERLDGGLPDIKETFEIGNEAEATYENRWPDEELPAFRMTMLEYFLAADQLHLDVLRCLAIGTVPYPAHSSTVHPRYAPWP